MEQRISVMQIGEVAKRTGMSQRTLRYYEEEGLVHPAGTTSGGLRLYDESDVTRLRFINRLRLLSISLDDIKIILGNNKIPPVNRSERINRTLDALNLSKQKIRESIELLTQTDQENETALIIVEQCRECPKPNCAGCLKKKYLL